jgi:O-antigen/teichoic acid export membrane protein
MLLRHTSHYLVASAVSAVFGLLSTIVFTRLLSPADYGVYVIGVSTAGVIAAVLFTWVRYAAMRFQSEGGGVDVRATTLAAYCVSVACAPLAFLFVLLVGQHTIAQAGLATMLALGLGLFELGQELLKARLQTRPYVLASVTRCVAAFAFCLPAAFFSASGSIQIIAAAMAYFVTAAIIAPVVWRAPRASIEWSRLGVFLSLGVSLTLSGFLFSFHAALDRLMIAWFLGDGAAGVYGASADLVRQMILVPAGSVAAAAVPLAVRAMAQGGAREADRQLRAGAELLLAILVPAVIGLALITPYLVALIMGPEFRQTAIQIIPILCFAWFFQSISQSYVHLSYHLAQRPGLVTVQGLLTLAVNMATLWPMIHAFGLVGAAVSLVVAEGAGTFFGFVLTARAHPLPSIWGPLARVGAAATAMGVVIVALQHIFYARSIFALAILILGGGVAYVISAALLNVAQSRNLALAAVHARFAVVRASDRGAAEGDATAA